MEVQIPERDGEGKNSEWVYPLLGWCMIGHSVFLASRTFLRGTPEDLFWISHVGTLLGGAGALFRNHRLISISLVALVSHHFPPFGSPASFSFGLGMT